MNINEQMNQLGKIGSVGYAPTDAVIDGLLAKTKRARAVRQGSAAVVGSVSAVALGVIGTQVYVTIDNRNDAATQDRNIENGLPGIFNFDGKYGGGYTGTDEATRDSLDKIYADLNVAAQIQAKHLAEQQAKDAAAAAAAAAAAGTPATANTGTTTCVYEEREWNGGIKYRGPATGCQWVFPDAPPVDPNTYYDPWLNADATCTGDRASEHSGIGYYNCVSRSWVLYPSYFQFGNNEIYKCENWTDAATGASFVGAISNKPVSGSFNGDWEGKRIYCQIGRTYTSPISDYTYMGTGSALAGWSGNVCTGATKTKLNAPHQYSCNTFGWIMTDPTNYKMFSDGRYYCISAPPAGWYWNGSAWAEVIVTPPPDPEPTPSVTPPTL